MSAASGRLVILNHEGALSRALDGYVLAPEQWEPLPGSLEAIAQLNHGGYRVAIATNQAPLSRGLLDMATLNAIHQRMSRLVEAFGGRLDAIAVCPHSPERACECRKPRPGMLLELMERFGTAPADTAMVGDTGADLEAGVAAGCRTWLVLSDRGRETLAAGPIPAGVAVADDLAAVARTLLESAGDEAAIVRQEHRP